MHRVFHPLTPAQVIFLLILMARGSHKDESLLDYLPDEQRIALKTKLDLLNTIPAEKRALLIAHEFKEIIQNDNDFGIDGIHPSWIVQKLEHESPRIVAAVMIGFSPSLLRQIVDTLPVELRKKLPTKQDMSQLNPGIIKLIQLQFARAFTPMPKANFNGVFKLSDVVHLDFVEINALLRACGIDELAQALSRAGRYTLAELLKRLPRDFAQELAQAVSLTHQPDAHEAKRAQHFLMSMMKDFTHVEELAQKAGLYRLAHALSSEQAVLHRIFKQRLPVHLAPLLDQFLKSVLETESKESTYSQRAQDLILQRLQKMAQCQQVSPRYLEYTFAFHQPPQVNT